MLIEYPVFLTRTADLINIILYEIYVLVLIQKGEENHTGCLASKKILDELHLIEDKHQVIRLVGSWIDAIGVIYLISNQTPVLIQIVIIILYLLIILIFVA